MVSERSRDEDGWLIRARLRPPERAGLQVARRGAGAAAWPEGASRVAIVAPPGFGKTGFLAAAYDRARHQGAAAGWFGCDAHDDVAAAIAYLARALETGPAPAGDPIRALQAIIAAADARRGLHYLFLDDLSASSDAVREQVLHPLLRMAPPHVRIMVALERIPLALERHIDHVVDQRGLRFGLDDVRALCGRGVTPHRARAILRQSQGWPALADILVDQHRRAHPDADARIARFARTRIEALLSPADRAALRHLAALGTFDMISARSVVAADILDGLLGLAVIAPVGQRDGRDHALNPALAALLVGDEPGDAAPVRVRTATDLLAHGHFVAATRLAVEIGDDQLLTAVIDACDLLSTFLGEGMAPLEKIVEAIPPHMAAGNLQVSCAALVTLLKTGHLRQARAIFDGLATRFAATLKRRDVSARLRVQVLIAKSLLDIHQGHDLAAEDLDELEALSGRMTEEIALLEMVTTMLRTHVHQLAGELGAARRSAERGARAAVGGGGRYAAFFHHFDIAILDGIEGRRAAACAELARISSAYRDILRSDPRIAVIRDAFRIELDHEADPGDLRMAGRLRTICRTLPSMEGWPDVFYAAYRTYSEKLVLAGDRVGALALLDAGTAYAMREDVAPLAFVLAHQRALIALMADDVVAAERAIAPYAGLGPAALAARPWREMEVCLEVRAALAVHRPDPAFAALLAHANDHARRHGNVRLLGRCAAVAGARGLRLAPWLDAAPERTRLAHLLTPRAREIIAQLRQGLTDKEIGLALGISPHGVRYHLKRAYAQMHVETRAQALLKADALGLLG